MARKQMTKSSLRIVPRINIFINICYGLQILKAIVYGSVEFRCVLCYMYMVEVGTRSSFPLFLFLVFFPFSLSFLFSFNWNTGLLNMQWTENLWRAELWVSKESLITFII